MPILRTVTTDELIQEIIRRMGDDPSREGLIDTPKRVHKSWKELFAGNFFDEAYLGKLLTTFKDGKCDEMIVLKQVEFFSCCEHHLLPFFGTASIAYIPGKNIVGISKLARLLEVYARRLQVQERLTEQITTAMDKYLKPRGSACVIQAEHLCMRARGVNKQRSVMQTASLTGAFRKDASTRAEFFNSIK